MRRRAILLAGGGGLALPAAAVLLPGGARPALGYGPLSLGMPRTAALRALGPGAVAAPLCGGAEGVLFACEDAALAPVPGRPVPAMAMFAADAVSEMEASLSDNAGGRDEAAWRGLVDAQLAELRRRAGVDPVAAGGDEGSPDASGLGVSRAWVLAQPKGTLRVRARWMRRSGACFTRLHWLAVGAPSVIG